MHHCGSECGSQVDLAALVPYYFSIILAGLEDLEIIGRIPVMPFAL
jgi:hypothetical protein